MRSWMASACSSLKQGFGSGQRLRSGCSSEIAETKLLDLWSVTRPWPCRKKFPQRWKVVKQVKCLLEGKEYSMCE